MFIGTPFRAVAAAAVGVTVLLGASPAWADTLQDTIDDNGAGVTLVAGSTTTGSASIRVVGNNASGDPDPGCNIDDNEASLVLDIVTPAGVTANPDPLSITSCGTEFSVAFSASSSAVSGRATVTVLSGPAGGGTYVNHVDIPITVTQPVQSDTTAPAAPSINMDAASDTGASSTDDITSDTTPTLNGLTEAGSTVEVFDGTVSLGTTTAATTGGAWTLTPSTALLAGTHSFTAKATDAAKNVSAASPVLAVTIDTDAPTKPTIDLVAASDTGASSTDNITGDNTPTLSGAAEAGSEVKVFDGGTLLETVTAGSGGTWTVTTGVLADGTHTLSAQATDGAGNISEASLTLEVQTDTAAPAKPTIDLVAASDTGASSTDNLTKDTTADLGGAAEAGSEVKVFDGSTSLGTVTAGNSGWSFTTAALAAGAHNLTVTATDTSGNTSVVSDTLVVTIDTTAPVIWIDPDFLTSYYFGVVPAQPGCEATDASGIAGNCTVTGYSTAVGKHTLTGSATDNAGNIGTADRQYTVLPYETKGFFQPVDMGNVLNTVKAGSTVPLKFELFRGAAELTGTSEVKSVAYAKTVCETGLAMDEIETLATSTAGLKYDTTAGQYVYTWKTPTAGCYKITMTSVDGSTISALFKSR